MRRTIPSSMTPVLRSVLFVSVAGASWGALFYAYMHFSETADFPSWQYVAGYVAAAVLGIFMGLSVHSSNILLNRWISWRQHFVARLVVGYVTHSLWAALLITACIWVLSTLAGTSMLWPGFSVHDPDLVLKTCILFLVSLFIYTIIYALLFSYQHYAFAQIDTLQSERKQLELQFEALKSQISPHYLFNSLNTISSLIFKDTPSAEQFVRRLAQTYQYILSTQHKPYVTLREEVEFVQSYYYLLRIRFQQQLTVDINLPQGIMSSRIPPLTLQMLVENAVKHNNLTSDKKLFIYITAQDNTYLKVINTKTESDFNVSSFKVGLENIRKRYRFFTEKQIEVRDDERFQVSLPVLHHRQPQNQAPKSMAI
jgi:sensor histidine kinase YesM